METPKLSPAKINPTKLLPGISISEKKISTQNLQEESISVLKSDLFIIKKQVFKIRDLIQTSTLIKQSELEKKRKSTEKKEAEEQENKLEAKPEKKEGKLKMPSAPKLGFLDRIKNFLFSVLLGYISIKLLPHLPKLVGIVSIIGNVMEFMIDLGGNILDKVVTFIDWGYKAIDATRGFMKSFGGDFSLKIFDTFTGAVGGVIDAAIIASIALSAMSGGDGGGGPGGGKPRVGGKGAGRVDPRAARKYAERFGRDAALKKFGKEGLGKLGGKYARSGATNLARKGLVGLAGKGGAKAVLGFARPFLKRLPIIGALIDFGLSVALGEDPGRAAFKAIGAGLLGFVGAAIGGPFAILTGLAGGAAGDWAGGALYDAFFGGKKPKAQKPQAVKAAGGGPAPVTRGNKIVGGAVKRTISRRPVKRGVKVQVTKVKPGGSLGGKKKIEKIFPEVPIKDKGKNVNPLGYMQSSYNIATKTPSFGALFALPLKAQLGEKPSSVDYMKAAEELSGWMQNTFRGTAGYAGGGKVEAGMFGGEDTTNVIAKSLEENVSSKVDDAIKDLQKQLMLKPDEGMDQSSKIAQKTKEEEDANLDVENGEFSVSGGNADFWSLVAVASREDGDSQGQADVAQSIYNRVASGIYGANTIKGIVTASGQYEPTFKNTADWKAITDIKSASIAAGKSESELKKVAAAITNKKYQDAAREFVGGRTDFMGGSNKPGPGDKRREENSPNNFFGWFVGPAAIAYGKKNPGPARAPKLGDVVVMGGGDGSTMVSVKGGKAFPLVKGRIGTESGQVYGAPRGYYGGHAGVDVVEKKPYGQDPKIPTVAYSGGKVLSERYNATDPYLSGLMIDHGGVQTRYLHTKPSVKPGQTVQPGQKIGNLLDLGNQTHLHFEAYKGGSRLNPTGMLNSVAYLKGGRVLKPTFATLAEDGRPEFVFDADTTAGLDSMTPNLLEYLNAAKTKPELMSILQSYAGYEDGAEQTVIVMNNPQMVPIPIPTGNSGSIGGMSRSSSIDTTYDIQYANA
jgi:murein DD-endopeptidase MepM/ murein hydrolase activator NlpD